MCFAVLESEAASAAAKKRELKEFEKAVREVEAEEKRQRLGN